MSNVVLIAIAIIVTLAVDKTVGDILSPTATYIVTLATILFFVFIYVIGLGAAGSATAKLHKLGEQLDTEQQSQVVETT